MVEPNFVVLLQGIVYNPETKKILIGKRENDPNLPKLTWCFPGGKLSYEKDLEKTLKKKIKEKTGVDVESLGTIFAKTYPEKQEFLSIYYLCEVVCGEEKPADDLIELKWVAPEELEDYFAISFHPKLKEYILNLK